MKKVVLLTALKLLCKCIRRFQSSFHQHFVHLKLNLKVFFFYFAARYVVYVLWPGEKIHNVTHISFAQLCKKYIKLRS